MTYRLYCKYYFSNPYEWIPNSHCLSPLPFLVYVSFPCHKFCG